MFIYHYHPNTFVYLGSEPADPDPEDKGRFLLPANATFTSPPDLQLPDNHVYIWNIQSQEWKLQEIPKIPIEEAWKQLRYERNRRLAECDWMFIIRDYSMTYEKEMKWRQYRQALRDIPSITKDPYNPDFPIKPNDPSI